MHGQSSAARIGPRGPGHKGNAISIKLKVALATTLLALALIGTVTALVLRSLRGDLAEVLTAQQTSLVNGAARELDRKLAQSLEILSRAAAQISTNDRRTPDELRSQLAALPALLVLFDDLIVLDASGQVIADLPQVEGRTNVNAADRAYFKQVMAEGRSVISEPVLGKQRREPIVNVGAPIRDADGKTVAVLTGVLRLLKSNLLGDLAAARIGSTGYFTLIAKRPEPAYVVHPDKSRILSPQSTVDALSIDRALKGFEGTIEESIAGAPALLSFKSLQATDWLLVAVFPSSEAFAPLRAVERNAALVAGAFALVAIPAVWLLVYALLAPLSRLRAGIQRMREPPYTQVRLPAERGDEVGELARAIDLLLAERAEAVRRQHESESRFVAAADSNLDAFLLLDAERNALGEPIDFRVRFANAQALELLGLPGERLLGQRISAILPLDPGGVVYQGYFNTLLTGEPLDREFRVTMPEIGAEWLHHKVVRVGDGLAVTAADVSRRRSAEAQIVRQKAFLQTLVQSLPIGLAVRSLRGKDAGKFIFWNAADEVIYGVPSQTAIGSTVRELFNPDIAERIEALDRARALRPTIEETIERWSARPGLATRTLRMIRAPVLGPDGGIDHVISIATDITDEQRKTDELRLASKVFESTADAIVLSDAEDRVILVNEAFTRLTGYAPEQMLGFLLADTPFRPLDVEASAARLLRQRCDGVVTAEVLRHRKDGTLLNLWVTATFVQADDGEILNNIRVFTDISELKATQRKLEALASCDSLTGLPNRRLFHDRLDQAIARSARSGDRVAVVFVDLDGFKAVNDTYGHDVGDRLLVAMATRLTRCVRGSDSVCRLGGDEFTLILEGSDTASVAAGIAARVLDACASPYVDGPHTLCISASVGLALYPDDAGDAPSLLQRADAAMYLAKRAGGGRHALSHVLSS